MKHLIIHPQEKASPDGMLTKAEAVRLSLESGGNAAFIYYEDGYYCLVYHKPWATFTLPLLLWHNDGETVFLDEEGNLACIVLKGGSVADTRSNGPFLPMLPCPWCGAEKEQDHAFARCSSTDDVPKEIFKTHLPMRLL